MKTKILLVDDEMDIRLLAKKLLESEGFEFIDASNVKEAISLAEEAHPKLVISDLLMPEQSGFDLLTQMKKKKELASIPLIMLTGKSETNDVLKAIELGADDYIVKPIDKNIFLQKIKKALRQPSSSEFTSFKAGSKFSFASVGLPVELREMSYQSQKFFSRQELKDGQNIQLSGKLFESLEIKNTHFKIIKSEPVEDGFLIEVDLKSLNKKELEAIQDWRKRTS